MKHKKTAVIALFAIIGAGYFSTFSQLDINFFLKGYIAVIPLQVAALLYVLYLRWNGRLPDTVDHLENEN
ncbi:MAG TPA: hypothetical protein V6C78_12345 [Crinalium sp.]|jgi:hypothetical protein